MTRLVALALLLALAGCATHRRPTLIPQRFDDDCVIASLAMLTAQPYDVVEEARRTLNLPEGGLVLAQITALAHALRWELVKQTSPTLTEGILVVRLREGTVHAVYIHRGWVYDPLLDLPLSLPQARRAWIEPLYGLRVMQHR